MAKRRRQRTAKRSRASVAEPATDLPCTLERLLSGTAAWPERVLMDVGDALRNGRTEQQHVDAADNDARLGVTFAPIDVVSCGFRFRAQPRRIGVREVAVYADQHCRSCHGQGWLSVQQMRPVGIKNGRKVMKAVAYERSCGCADKRYKEMHRLFLIDSARGEWIGLDGLTIEEVAADDATSGAEADDARNRADSAGV